MSPDGLIVLVGAPGSGKSTIGTVLAEQLGVAFCDIDSVIVERVGKPVAEISRMRPSGPEEQGPRRAADGPG